MSQRVSLSCVLSTLSPVVMTSWGRRPLIGLRADLMRPTIASTTCVVVPPLVRKKSWNGAPNLSVNSPRTGDSSSTIWKSLSWPKTIS